ncbi:MAG: NADH-quinone oxidoreductase subunit H [Candidatus Hydrogenedentes bacterium]|nr:NADH-quinone oxidoreductase subunit H [Candidatus Hydrogenedentota bacterium]
MTYLFDTLLHAVLLLAAPPLFLGVINKTKAFFAGRMGPPLLQVYFDLFKLFRKGLLLSRTTTWVFLAGPAAGVVTALGAGILVPFGHHAAPLSFTGDVLLLAYLMAMGRFLTAAAALDTGSSFEGMGAAREVTFSSLAEPATFLGLVALARVSGSLSLTPMLAGLDAGHMAVLVLIAGAWFLVLLAENCRIPFDDPNTHLELTMIHEVMVLDHSGPGFGMVLYGAAIKLFVMAALVLDVALPLDSGHTLGNWVLFAAGMAVLSVAIGVIESTMARVRLVTVPKLLVCACLLSAFAVVMLVRP